LKSSGLVFVVTILLLWACDPCNDCGPIEQEPTIGLFFVNADSLQTTTDSLEVVDTLIFVSDSLNIVNDSIANGALGYEDEQLALENFIDGLTHLRSVAEDLSDSLSQINILLTSILSDIEDGNVLIDQLLLVETGFDSIFTDSTSEYYAPLLMTAEETELSITIANIPYQLTLAYDLFDEIDIDHRVQRRAQNVTIKSHSFDSVKIACNSINFDCNSEVLLDNETIITCYF
jgi:hypothetical protein